MPGVERRALRGRSGAAGALRTNFYALTAFVAGLVVLRWYYQLVHGAPLVLPAVRYTWVVLTATVVVAVVAHELLHGLVMRLHGASPGFRAGIDHGLLPEAYTVMHQPLAKTRFLHVVLAPGLYLTAGCLAVVATVPALAPWFLLAALANIAGSVSDFELALVVGGYPAWTRFVDEGDGVCALIKAN